MIFESLDSILGLSSQPKRESYSSGGTFPSTTTSAWGAYTQSPLFTTPDPMTYDGTNMADWLFMGRADVDGSSLQGENSLNTQSSSTNGVASGDMYRGIFIDQDISQTKDGMCPDPIGESWPTDTYLLAGASDGCGVNGVTLPYLYTDRNANVETSTTTYRGVLSSAFAYTKSDKTNPATAGGVTSCCTDCSTGNGNGKFHALLIRDWDTWLNASDISQFNPGTDWPADTMMDISQRCCGMSPAAFSPGGMFGLSDSVKLSRTAMCPPNLWPGSSKCGATTQTPGVGASGAGYVYTGGMLGYCGWCISQDGFLGQCDTPFVSDPYVDIAWNNTGTQTGSHNQTQDLSFCDTYMMTQLPTTTVATDGTIAVNLPATVSISNGSDLSCTSGATPGQAYGNTSPISGITATYTDLSGNNPEIGISNPLYTTPAQLAVLDDAITSFSTYWASNPPTSNTSDTISQNMMNVVNSYCPSFPGLCDDNLQNACATVSISDLTSSPALLKMCGCFLSDEQYTAIGIVPVECQSICTLSVASGGVPRGYRGSVGESNSTQTGAGVFTQKVCEQSTCMIDGVSLDILNSTVEGGVTFEQICPGCSNGNTQACTCSVSSVSDAILNSFTVGGIDFTQNCGCGANYTSNTTTAPTSTCPNGATGGGGGGGVNSGMSGATTETLQELFDSLGNWLVSNTLITVSIFVAFILLFVIGVVVYLWHRHQT